MDYSLHYERLITRAKNRVLEGYKEKHHIIPKCMGGDDSAENLVELTGAEHYVAHQLLFKMNPGNHKLAHALKIMMGSINYNNKQFEWVRKRAVETSIAFHTGRKRSKETCEKISKAIKGKRLGIKFTKEHRENLSKSLKGGKFSEAHKKKLSDRIFTDEWRKNLSKAQRLRTWEGHSDKIKAGFTDETRQKLSEINKSHQKTCPHCGKTTNAGNYSRWHGDNCKEFKNGL